MDGEEEESRVEGGELVKLPYLDFFKRGGEGIWRGSNYF